MIQFASGTINGGGSFTVQQAGLPRGVSASIVTNGPNNSIDVLLTPSAGMGRRDERRERGHLGQRRDHQLESARSGKLFTNNDNVQIDDTATGSTTLNLTETLSPFTVLVTNNALNYTISATGGSALTGGMTLTKKGSGNLTITESNSFTGGVNISGGAVNIQNNYAFNTNIVAVASGAELELQGGISVPAVTALTLNSTGTNNTGGLRDLSGNNAFWRSDN